MVPYDSAHSDAVERAGAVRLSWTDGLGTHEGIETKLGEVARPRQPAELSSSRPVPRGIGDLGHVSAPAFHLILETAHGAQSRPGDAGETPPGDAPPMTMRRCAACGLTLMGGRRSRQVCDVACRMRAYRRRPAISESQDDGATTARSSELAACRGSPL